MSARGGGGGGSMAMTAGLIIVLLAVSAAGFNFGGGGFGLLLSFAGVLAGASIIAAGVRMADDDPAAPVGPAAFDGTARALAAFLRRHLAVVGLVVASSAVTAVSGEAGAVLCFGMFALLLLALSIIAIGVLGE
ncbi:uncharacterized protein LOC120677687 [Panicum virgatum]|jgi:hypothetical protein|uniref:Uncharacterized protein n=1 Tax=Panicum virgatum TaxID=38727 RepID=A0A8T0QVZ5_PANVG|nr:uncharacterized protein LOC120677687 [Panicum virgatum]KAG2577169.1 hypothetical protein PVAP13_6NG085400 [Panicum virgatum]